MQQFENIWERKNKPSPALDIKEIYEYDLDSIPEELDEYCQKADFVFNLAGVNRPENPEDFMKGNFGFASELLNCLKKNNNKVNIMLFSSIQAIWQTASATASMVAARRQARSCSLWWQVMD